MYNTKNYKNMNYNNNININNNYEMKNGHLSLMVYF